MKTKKPEHLQWRIWKCASVLASVESRTLHSFVREQAGIASSGEAYAQSAVVANFACERPHLGAALQWFQGGPVLALLPLPGERVSMVWSSGEAERLLALDAQSLCREVGRASGHMAGR